MTKRLARSAIATVVAMSVAVLSACGSTDSPADMALPEVELVSADGMIESASLLGEPLVINFWYSTCAPCAKELKEFADVHAELGDKVRFVGINPLDTPERMQEFAAERGVDYELYRDELGDFQTQLEITSFPATVFVTSAGSVVETTGVLDAAGLRRRIDALLAVRPDGADPAADQPTSSADATDTGEWYGIRRDPAPAIGAQLLPSLTEPGSTIDLRPPSGRVTIVYFGFTNCPDICPTTMADLSVALRRLGDRADSVDVVMISVDPDRDSDHLADYVRAFVPDGRAAATDDLDVLREVAAPFGANWDVRSLDDGTIEVDHTPFLYAVDDSGTLAVTWQFGTSSEHLADDITRILDLSEASS